MPYEQYMGQATPASDLYALGATFLHLITGRPPREFMNAEGRIAVPAMLPGDERLRAMLERLLRPSPAERFASAREARQALLSPAGVLPVHYDLQRGAVAPAHETGPAAELVDHLAPSVHQLVDSSAKPNDRTGPLDWALVTLVSVLTFGFLPLVFFSIARSRRRQLRRFVRDGTPAVAEILTVRPETTAFGQQAAKVAYQFEADGQLRRGADQVLQTVGDRWHPGDRIHVLYLPLEGYDSVIIST